MSPSEYDPFDTVVDALPGAVAQGADEVRAPCPAHDGDGLNLAVYRHALTSDRRLGMKCYSHDCDPAEVLAAIGLTLSHQYYDHDERERLTFAKRPKGFKVRNPKRRTYDYLDANGTKVGWVTRDKSETDDEGNPISKTFQGRYDEDGEKVTGLDGVTLPLYRLPEVLASARAPKRYATVGKQRRALATAVYVTEGEKDADNLQRYFDALGFTEPVPVTTTPGGGAKALVPEWVEPLRAFDQVLVIVDRDETGYRRGLDWIANLPTALVFEPSEGKDISDVLAIVKGDLGEYLDPLTPSMLVERVADVAQELWRPPIPLSQAVALPPFPVGSLTGALGDMAKATSNSLGVDIGMPAMQGLAAVAAVIGGRAVIEVKADWTERGTVWCLPMAESGQMKTQCHEFMLGPLALLQQEVRDADTTFDARRREWEATQRAMKQAQDAYGKALGSGDAKKTATTKKTLDQVAEVASDLVEPVPYRFVQKGGDVTSEALGRSLHQHDEFIAVTAHEGGFIDVLAGLYSEGRPKLDLLLQSYDGSGRDEDRLGRDGYDLQHPVTVVCVSPQPSVLEEHSRNPSLRGRGLWARFTIYVVPHREELHLDGDPIPSAVIERYHRMLRRMLKSYERYSTSNPCRFTLTTEGTSIVKELRREFYRRSAPDSDDLDRISDIANKAAGKVVRIALVLWHGATAASGTVPADLANRMNTTGPVSIPTRYVEAAERIVRASIDHSLVAMNLLRIDPVAHAASTVIRRIHNERPSEIDARWVQQRCHQRWRGRGGMRSEEARQVLDLLYSCGWIRPGVPTLTQKGTPSLNSPYDVNPLAAASLGDVQHRQHVSEPVTASVADVAHSLEPLPVPSKRPSKNGRTPDADDREIPRTRSITRRALL